MNTLPARDDVRESWHGNKVQSIEAINADNTLRDSSDLEAGNRRRAVDADPEHAHMQTFARHMEAGIARCERGHRISRQDSELNAQVMNILGVRHEGIERVPRSMKEAMRNKNFWLPSVAEEIKGLMDKGVWKRVKRSSVPDGVKMKRYLPVFSIKKDLKGEVIKRKFRLVLRGDLFVRGTDFDSTFSPTARAETLRLVQSLACARGWDSNQFDVTQAFVNAHMDTDIYTEFPPGWFEVTGEIPPADEVLVLVKALYGAPQASRLWTTMLASSFREAGLTQSKHDPCLFFSSDMMAVVHVDDSRVFSKNRELYEKLCDSLEKDFPVKRYENKREYVGLELEENDNEIILHQKGYVKKFKEALCEQDHSARVAPFTPLPTNISDVERRDEAAPEMEGDEFQKNVGMIGWLARQSRPDLSHAFSFLGSLQSRVTKVGLALSQRVMRYAVETSGYEVIYRKQNLSKDKVQESMSVCVMVDSDWAGELDRKSRTGYLIFLTIGGRQYLVVWSSGKQTLIAKSSAEAEIIATSKAIDEGQFVRNVLSELGYGTNSEIPIVVLGDNEKALELLTGEVAHQRTRHIDIHYKSVCEVVKSENVHLRHVPGAENLADILTKPVDRQVLEKHCNVIFRIASQ